MDTMVAGAVVFVAGAATIAVVAVAQTVAMPPCSLEHPCLPDALENSFIGVLLTLPFLGWVGLRFAAVVAVGAELMVIAHDVWYPASRLVAVHVAVVALVVVCVVLARRVPAEPMQFRPGPAQFARAAVLLVAGLAVAGYAFHRQVDADAQTRSARIVTVTVTARLGEDAIAVDAHGTVDGPAPVQRVYVVDPAAYPVGSQQRLAVDDAGLRQLVAEPYDATLLLIPAVFAVLVGAGRVWRLREAAAGPRPEKVVPEPGAWPSPGPEALLVAVVVVLGLVYWEPVMSGLVRVVCGPGSCPPLPMVLIGWGAIAVPMFALVAIPTLARPGRLALWWIYVAFSLLAFGCSVLIAADDLDFSPRQPAFFAVHPGSFSTLAGSGLMLAALPLAAPFVGALQGKARLLVLAGAELAVLLLAIWLGS